MRNCRPWLVTPTPVSQTTLHACCVCAVLDTQRATGCKPIHFSSRFGHAGTVDLLVRRGAGVNALDLVGAAHATSSHPPALRDAI